MRSRRDAVMAGVYLAANAFSAGAHSPNSPASPAEERNVPTYTVEMFGGRADGVTDNTDAISRALGRIRQSGGGALQLNQGVYRFRSIDFDLDNITICGCNSTLKSSLPKDTDTAAIWLRGDNIWMRDLTIDYDVPIVTDPPGDLQKRRKNGYGLRIGGRRDPKEHISQEVRVENVTVKNARNGGISVYKSRIARVTGCTVLGTLGNGIGFDGCQDLVIASGNIVENTGDDLLVVVTDKSVPGGTKSVIFTGNIVRLGWAKGIGSTGVDRLVVSGNIIEDTFAGGISIIQDNYYGLGQSNNVIVDGNYVYKSGRRFGPGMYHEQECTVGDSIYVSSGTHNIKISNNTMDDGSSNGIRVTRSPFLSVVGNTILNHPGRGVVAGDVRGADKNLLSNFIIESNQISVNNTGIVVGGGAGGRVSGNVITCLDIQTGSAAGIQYGSLSGCIVSENVVTLQNPGGIIVEAVPNTKNISVREYGNLLFIEQESADVALPVVRY